ncbi:MAG: flagellar hook-length control protein FliK [Pirellulaceae bacterium]|nr:flagellar hook-length control protein FliK [Pirellulaceae bacterium]
MELPVASTPLTSERPEPARRAAGSTASSGLEDSFRVHWQTSPPAAQPAPERPDDPPPTPGRTASAPADPALPDEHPAGESPDTSAEPVMAAPAPASPAVADEASQAAPALTGDVADTPAPMAERVHPPSPAPPTSRTDRLASDSAPQAPVVKLAGKSPDPRSAPGPIAADVPVVATHVTALEPTATGALPVVPDPSAVAADAPPRRAAATRGDSRPRAAGTARAEGGTSGETPVGTETVARGGPRAPLSTAAVDNMASAESASRRELDPGPADAPQEGSTRGDQGVRAAGLPERLAHHLTTRSDAPSPSGVPVTATEQHRLLQRVARAIEAAAERGGVLRLRLRPPELGSLRLEVALEPGKLTARIETETPQARAILLDNLPQLRARLAEQGMVVERFDVDVSARDADQPSSGPRDWDPPGSSSAPTRRPSRAEATAPEPPASATHIATTTPGTLNVVI